MVMSEYIKLADALAIISAETEKPQRHETMDEENAFLMGLCVAHNLLNKVQAADVRDVVHGEWENVVDSGGRCVQDEEYDYVYRCPECGAETIGRSNFCPECGADMRPQKKKKEDTKK